MMSESNTRRLLLTAGGLAAVGLASLGGTFLASDRQVAAPDVSTGSTVPAMPPTTVGASLAPTTTVMASTLPPETTPVTTTVPPPAPTLEVGQVWVFNDVLQSVAPYSFDTKSMLGAATLPLRALDADYQSNGGTAALYNSLTGELWIGSATDLLTTGFPVAASTILPPGAEVVVTTAGDVVVVGLRDIAKLELGLDLTIVEQQATARTPAGFGQETTVTTVGENLVFLNPDGIVFGDGWSTSVPGENPVLQQPSAGGDAVLVATSTGLFEVTLNSEAEPVALHAATSGVPGQPVRVGDCAYAAWSGGAPTWVKKCLESNAVVVPLAGVAPTGELVFRVDGLQVALNDVSNGGVWVENDSALEHVVEVWPNAKEVQS